jgi:RNA polymerase sigma-B factor
VTVAAPSPVGSVSAGGTADRPGPQGHRRSPDSGEGRDDHEAPGDADDLDGPDSSDSADPADSALETARQSGPDTDALLERLATLGEDDPGRGPLRDTVVTSHLPLVHHIARRFHGRGEPHDDLVQVGTIGLIKAVDRFEPGRGVPFAGYAVPTVTGEIRRHFRDRAGTVRLPRRVQEVQVAVTQARESLTHELERTPTVDEVATRAGLDSDTVLEVLESAYSLTTVPLDVDNGVRDTLGEEDVALDMVLTREALRPVLARLEPRERRIIALRFVRGMSQSQIADEVGISQMHVSRLLSKTLTRLRSEMTRPEA